MKIIIAGGTGFVGRYLTAQLQQRGDKVAIISRDKNKIKKIYADSVEGLHWRDLNSQQLKQYDAIINLAGENINKIRWTKKFKQEIVESRIFATRTLATLCAELGNAAPRILNANAVGIYGTTGCYPQQPIPVDENWQVPFSNPQDYLSDVAMQWEKALTPAVEKNIQVTVMRFGVVLKNNEGMLRKLAIPVKLGLAGKLGSGKQWLSWIHINDLTAAIIFLLDHPNITGPINLTHPIPVTQADFIHAMTQHYHRPCIFNMPRWLVKCLFGEMGEVLLLGGQKVVPTKLESYGFKFSKRTIHDAFD